MDRNDTLLLSQVGLEAPHRPSTPSTAKGKRGVDEVEVEIVEQPLVVGLYDSDYLNHDTVGHQLLRHHEWQPYLVVKGLRGEGEVHMVVGLDGLCELVDDVCNTCEHGELGLGLRVVGDTGGIIVKAYNTMHDLTCTTRCNIHCILT